MASSVDVWFVSAHLDDVVLSCTHRLRGLDAPKVVTVFSDGPAVERHEGWNRRTTGEVVASTAQAVRRAEDQAALGSLGIGAAWLDRFEAEYCDGPQDVGAITEALGGFLDGVGASLVVGPVGLRHPDHVAVSDAVLALIRRTPIEGRLYLDLPYAVSFPDLVGPRLDAIRSAGHEIEELSPAVGAAEAKIEAFAHYGSQVAAVRADHPGFERSMSAPERWWAVSA